jgi:Glycosyl hydrolase family 26
VESSRSSLRFAALALTVSLVACTAPAVAQASVSPARHAAPVACKASRSAAKSPRRARRCTVRRATRTAAFGAQQLRTVGFRPGAKVVGSPQQTSKPASRPAKRPVTTPVPGAVTTPVASAASAPPVTTPPLSDPAPVPDPDLSAAAGAVYWGAWIGSHITGTEAPWDVGAINQFEQHAGKGVSLVNFSNPFANCFSTPCKPYNFPAGEFNTIRGHGAIPFFSWANDALPVSGDQSAYQLSDVIAGRHDAYITAWATAAKAWGHPFFLRFNWEMNGSWFPWSEGVNGNQTGEYVAAWRHVHDIFTRVGATNTTWTWCPNVDPGHTMQSLANLYPGDAYVDWTCLDGYNFNQPRTSFKDLFKPTYDAITSTIAPNKPMIIGETGSTEAGGSKAQWITDMFAALPHSFPKVHGLQYFDKFDDGMDWPIETSAAATAAFKAGISGARYQGSQYAGLNGLSSIASAT